MLLGSGDISPSPGKQPYAKGSATMLLPSKEWLFYSLAMPATETISKSARVEKLTKLTAIPLALNFIASGECSATYAHAA